MSAQWHPDAPLDKIWPFNLENSCLLRCDVAVWSVVNDVTKKGSVFEMRESSSSDITPCCRRHDAPETLVWEHNITTFNLNHKHKYQIFTISFHIYSDIPNNIFPERFLDKFVLSFQESTLWDKEIKWHVWQRRPAIEKLTNTDGGLCFYPLSCTCCYLITSCINIWSLRQRESTLPSNLLPHQKKTFLCLNSPGLSAYPSA
jgi:hypothetical protein